MGDDRQRELDIAAAILDGDDLMCAVFDERNELRARIDAVLAFHKPFPHREEGEPSICGECFASYPCPTVVALTGEET